VPVAVVAVGVPDAPAALGRRGVPVYRLPEPAVHAFGRAVRYAAWQRAPLGGRPALSGIHAAAAREIVGHALRGGDGWQPAGAARQLLRAYGIPVLDAAVEVQRTAASGVELFAGITHDPLFGSLVKLGLGGPAALRGDPVLRLLPVTDRDAATMWQSLPGAPQLLEHRADLPVDTDTLEDLLLRLGRLAEDLPEVAELSLDPVLAGPSGCIAVNARLRLSAVGSEPDPYLRDLLQRPDIDANREPKP
jgi:hypothetical protein